MYNANPKFARTKLYTKRAERNLTMRQVEKLTGVHPGQLSTYERAIYEPKVTVAIRLAKFFHSTVEELFS